MLGRHLLLTLCVWIIVVAAALEGVECWAGETNDARSGWLSMGVGVEQEWAERLSVGDSRPTARGFAGGRLDIGAGLSESWGLGLTIRLVGARDAFSGLGGSGRIDDVAWAVDFGADRFCHESRSTIATVGVGIGYGEARSWLRSTVEDERGPTNYCVGPFMRASLAHKLGENWWCFAESQTHLQFERAQLAVPAAEHRWVGNSLNVAVGLRSRINIRKR